MMETTIAKKRVKIYKNGDNSFEGLDFIINTDQFKNMQELLNIINEKIGLTNGAKKLYTLNGELIQSVEQIISDKEYVAATNVFKPLLYGQMKFITSTDKIDKLTMINSEISSLASTKVLALRMSRNVEMKRGWRKESVAEKKSKNNVQSQRKLSDGNNNASKAEQTKPTKLVKESNVAKTTISNTSQAVKGDAVKFISTNPSKSSKSSLAEPIIKSSKALKMDEIKMNKTSSMITGELSKCSLLSIGQRPSTTSIKNRTPTPKPGAKIYQPEKGRKNTAKQTGS
ncbi:Doublecortin family protein [Brugia pahangi]